MSKPVIVQGRDQLTVALRNVLDADEHAVTAESRMFEESVREIVLRADSFEADLQRLVNYLLSLIPDRPDGGLFSKQFPPPPIAVFGWRERTHGPLPWSRWNHHPDFRVVITGVGVGSWRVQRFNAGASAGEVRPEAWDD